MTYGDLRAFLENTMRMSHVYQPAMLLALLDAGGEAEPRRVERRVMPSATHMFQVGRQTILSE